MILKEQRDMCKSKADSILGKGWEKENKNTLCNLYIQNKDTELGDAYFAAIMCRYWSALDKYWYKSYSSASQEDCFDMFVEALTYAFSRADWLDEKSSMYNDPNGPDKIINRCIIQARARYYQFTNKHKRKLNYGISSIEEMQDYYDNECIEFNENDKAPLLDVDIELEKVITKYFDDKDYFKSFLVDFICYGDCFKENQLDIHKLKELMYHIDDSYCEMFSKRYNIDINRVNWGASYIKRLDLSDISKKISRDILELRYNKDLLKCMRNK